MAEDLQPVRVERATAASRIFALVAALGLAALASLPWWGDTADMRLIGEMACWVASSAALKASCWSAGTFDRSGAASGFGQAVPSGWPVWPVLRSALPPPWRGRFFSSPASRNRSSSPA